MAGFPTQARPAIARLRLLTPTSTSKPTDDADGLPAPRRQWALLALALAIVMAVLDGAIANVALPTIGRELGASPAASIWIVNAYQIGIVVALLPLAWVGEIVGYRRVSQAGLVVFTLASLACAASTSLLGLSLARVVQGFGAAGIMSVNAALLRFTYPHSRLGRAIGLNALVVSIASAAGPTLAGAILSVADWRWLFGVNVPLGFVAVVIGWRTLPHNPLVSHPSNWLGAVLNAATFGLLITGFQALGHDHLGGLAAGEIAAGLIAGALLVRREARRASPIIPLDLLRIRLFRLSVATSICSFAAATLALVSLPFDFEARMGFSPVATGLLMTPWPLGAALVAPFAGRLADRHSPGVLGGAGLAILALGLGLLAASPAHPAAADIVWRMGLCGLGFGLFQSPNGRALIGSAPRARAGAAGGALSAARLIGQCVGAVGVATLFRLSATHGVTFALALAAFGAVIAAGVSLTRGGLKVAPPSTAGVGLA